MSPDGARNGGLAATLGAIAAVANAGGGGVGVVDLQVGRRFTFTPILSQRRTVSG